MNAFIETLNLWGGHFLNLAWPMLWQSSLLIVLVFALDYLLARKIRPAVRHALWLVVLVKLILPPALALPTGAAWWLWPAKPAFVPVIKNETVSYGAQIPLPNFPSPSIPVATPPPPQLSLSARGILVSLAVSAALLAWLSFHCLRVSRLMRPAVSSDLFTGHLDAARQMAGLRRSLSLKVLDDTLSPAVYGLFRPVILLPGALAEKLSATQLRTVLLHEAIHVRRGDVWVNCAQTLLQILYWWHPLLWFANARIRRVREEAVDDAVMVALHAEADTYAPTLLEVAKFAFRRPLASLGLVGILESRSALRQRVERLLHFPAPRKAGVTLLSLCGIVAFSAVALPMGQAPASTSDLTPVGQLSPRASAPSSKTAILIDGRFFRMREDDFQKLTAGLSYDQEHRAQKKADPEQFTEINRRIQELNVEPFARPLIQTSSGIEADVNISNQDSAIEFDCTPFITNSQVDLDFKTLVTSISLHETTYLRADEHATVENNGGVIISFVDPKDALNNLVLVINAQVLHLISSPTNPPVAVDVGIPTEERTFKVDPAIFYSNLIVLSQATNDLPNGLYRTLPNPTSNVSLLVKKYFQSLGVIFNPPKNVFFDDGMGLLFVYASPQDWCVIEPEIQDLDRAPPQTRLKAGSIDIPFIDGGDSANNGLEKRTFRVGLAALTSKLKEQTGATDPRDGLKILFANAGVDLSPPKTIFIINGMGLVWVEATHKDLDAIESIILQLNCPPPQIHIKARFFEVPAMFFTDAHISLPAGVTNGTGLLTAAESRELLHELESYQGTVELAEPEATTIAGRQTEMRATETIPVITKYSLESTGGPNAPETITPHTEDVEVGPIFDIVPYVLEDGYTISLKTIPSLVKFCGYASTEGLPPIYGTNQMGKKITLPASLPAFQVAQSTSTQTTLYDSQTLFLFPKPEAWQSPVTYPPDKESRQRIADQINQYEKKHPEKTILTFMVTVTLIDFAGNRVHSDEELSFTQNSFPPPWPPKGGVLKPSPADSFSPRSIYDLTPIP